MERPFHLAILKAGAVFLAILAPASALAQGGAPASLAEQLEAQYTPVKMGSDANGPTITEPGTVFAIQKGGILAVKPSSVAICPSKYQDGNLKGPNAFCSAMVKQNSRYFTVGEKVYLSKLEVNPGKDKISVSLVDCDTCNGSNPPQFYKAELVFQFAKGSLQNANVPQIQDTIAQVLTIDDSGGQDQGGQQAQDAGAAAPAEQANAAPTQPQNIQLGQTTDEVVAALGQPQKVVNLGAKQIYVYKDLKITFLHGKVSDVQ